MTVNIETVMKPLNDGLIINADDFGRSHDINLAIIELLKSGRINHTTIMVNMPYFNEAFELAKDNMLLDRVGLHINLTNGVPLSEPIKKTRLCRNGEFDFEQIRKVGLFVSKSEREVVGCEVLAQFDKFKQVFGYYPKHIDSHRHVHSKLGFLPEIVRVAKSCGIESMRLGINLYGTKKVGLLKRAYKLVVNAYIRANFKSTDYFGSWWDYKDSSLETTGKTIEIMVHPVFHHGKIMDIVCDSEKEYFFDFDRIG